VARTDLRVSVREKEHASGQRVYMAQRAREREGEKARKTWQMYHIETEQHHLPLAQTQPIETHVGPPGPLVSRRETQTCPTCQSTSPAERGRGKVQRESARYTNSNTLTNTRVPNTFLASSLLLFLFCYLPTCQVDTPRAAGMFCWTAAVTRVWLFAKESIDAHQHLVPAPTTVQ